MAKRLETSFDRAVDASLREVAPQNLGGRLDSYLADAHAIEAQSLQLLGKAPDLAGDERLAEVSAEHRSETERQQQQVADLIAAYGLLARVAHRAGEARAEQLAAEILVVSASWIGWHRRSMVRVDFDTAVTRIGSHEKGPGHVAKDHGHANWNDRL
jgi:hypothetical protein